MSKIRISLILLALSLAVGAGALNLATQKNVRASAEPLVHPSVGN